MLARKPSRRAPIRVALTGACGGYGRTLLAQIAQHPDIVATQLVDPDIEGVRTMLAALGYAQPQRATADRDATARAMADGALALVERAEGVDPDGFDVMVEATGRIGAGYRYARDAIAHGRHVVMVSKEVESVAGVALAGAAAARGVRYLPGDGDQPANLVRLVDWVERVGLEIVALGKSGEYDIVIDPDAQSATYLDHTVALPQAAALLALDADVSATLAVRAEAVQPFKRSAAADVCEMSVVGLYTGYAADVDTLHYPVARPAELADIYAERAHGGIIRQPGSVDVFSMLRRPDEMSFAGGVFVVVRTHDEATWQLLAEKGHIVSRDRRYACIAWPYHTMGVETPLSILAAVDDTASVPAPAQHVVLSGRAACDLTAGRTFAVAGHHHEIDDVTPVIRRAGADAHEIAPFYLLDGARLVRDVKAGELVRFADLERVDDELAAAFKSGLAGGVA